MSGTHLLPRREPAPALTPAPALALALKLVAGRGVEKFGLIPLAPEGCGMARALAFGDPSLGTVRWRAADRCRIAMRGEEWLISNHCRWLVCALNGRRVRADEPSILRIGDTLELDLLRFLVVVDPGVDRRTGALDGLAIGARAPHSADAAKRRQAAPDDLLDRLNDEFVAAARSPLYLAGHAEWRQAEGPVADEAPSIDELCAYAKPFPSLRDLLVPREGIDRIIEGFDGSGAVDTPPNAPEADVLRLFAPEIEDRSASRLPGLTRREHHAVSIDSAIALGDVRPGDDRMDR